MFDPKPKLATVLYGASDDLVEINGEQSGEAENYSSSPKKLLVRSEDGEEFNVNISYTDDGSWRIEIVDTHMLDDEHGVILDTLPSDWEDKEDEVGYSDQLHLPSGWRVCDSYGEEIN